MSLLFKFAATSTVGEGGLPPAPPSLIAEGDSITASNGGDTGGVSYARKYASDHPTLPFADLAVGGSALSDMTARIAAVLSSDATVVTVMIGANELAAYSGAAYANMIFTYTDQVRAAGKKVLLCTILPRETNGADIYADWDAKRAVVKAAMIAAIGTHCDDVIDFDDCAAGANGAGSNHTLFYDGLHPTAAAYDLMKPIYATTVNHWVSIANEPLNFSFAAVADADPDTDITGDPYTVQGLYPGEVLGYAMVGGKVSKNGGAFVANGTGTVIEGDTLTPQVRSDDDAAGEVEGALTVGTTEAIFSVTTEGAGARLWIPTDLGSKLAAWQRAEDITGADGANLSPWVDSSGNSKNLSQGANAPKVETTGINGYNVTYFPDGGNTIYQYPSGHATGRTSLATFAVSKNLYDPPSSNVGGVIGDFGSSGDDRFPHSNGGVYSSYGRASRVDDMNPTPALTDWHIVMFLSASADWRFTLDGGGTGKSFTQGTNTVSVNTGSPQIGGASGAGYWNGWVAEVVDLNAAPTDAERYKIEGYLAWKFGLQANLPAGHAYELAAPTI